MRICIRLLLIGLVLGACLLAACAPAEVGEPAADELPRAGVTPPADDAPTAPPDVPEEIARPLEWCTGDTPPVLDPALAEDCISRTVVNQAFAGLTHVRGDGQIVYELARSHEVSADGLTWTFHLREDAWWVSADGEQQRPITAHDAAAAVERARSPEYGGPYGLPGDLITGAEALDDLTVQYTLSRPAAYFPALLAMPVMFPLPLDPSDGGGVSQPGELPAWFSGPYVGEWVHEDHLILQPNPYYCCAMLFNARPALSWRALAAPPETSQALLDGLDQGCDLITGFPPDLIPEMLASAAFEDHLAVLPSYSTYYYGLNTAIPPFDDVRVRRAFTYAIDRMGLVWMALDGMGEPALSVIPPGIAGSPPDSDLRYDMEYAADQLAQAGYPGGAGFPPVTLAYNASPLGQAVAEFCRDSWRELGVEVELLPLELPQLLDAVFNSPPEEVPHLWRLGVSGSAPHGASYLDELLTYLPSLPGWDRAGVEGVLEAPGDVALDDIAGADRLITVDEVAIIPLFHPADLHVIGDEFEAEYTYLGWIVDYPAMDNFIYPSPNR